MSVEKIILKKDGIFTKDGSEQELEDVSNIGLISFLNRGIEVDPDFTLGDLFKIIERHLDEYDLVFSSHLGRFPLKIYIDDINKECPLDDRENMSYLEVYWSAEYFDHYKFNKEHPDGFSIGDLKMPPSEPVEEPAEITIYAGFHGWGEYNNDQINEQDKPQFGGFAIEFTPLRKLKHLPLHLNKNFILYDESGEFKEIVKGEREFTVYDVISSILFEISFAGEPSERDKKWEEIESDVENWKQKIEEDEKRKDENENKDEPTQ